MYYHHSREQHSREKGWIRPSQKPAVGESSKSFYGEKDARYADRSYANRKKI